MEPFTLTIPEFCRLHGISRGTYYNLAAQGLSPREMRVGSRVLITIESAAEWRRAMEARAAAQSQAAGNPEQEATK